MKYTYSYGEMDFECDIDYTPPYTSRRDGYGLPTSPDEPEDVEIVSVMYAGKEFIELLSSETLDKITQEVYEYIKDQRQMAEYDRAEDAYNNRMEDAYYA